MQSDRASCTSRQRRSNGIVEIEDREWSSWTRAVRFPRGVAGSLTSHLVKVRPLRESCGPGSKSPSKEFTDGRVEKNPELRNTEMGKYKVENHTNAFKNENNHCLATIFLLSLSSARSSESSESDSACFSRSSVAEGVLRSRCSELNDER